MRGWPSRATGWIGPGCNPVPRMWIIPYLRRFRKKIVSIIRRFKFSHFRPIFSNMSRRETHSIASRASVQLAGRPRGTGASTERSTCAGDMPCRLHQSQCSRAISSAVMSHRGMADYGCSLHMRLAHSPNTLTVQSTPHKASRPQYTARFTSTSAGRDMGSVDINNRLIFTGQDIGRPM